MVINTIKREAATDVKTTERNMVEDGKVIRNAKLARRLLREGGEDVRIIDIKASRESADRSVFVFRNDAKFQELFTKILDELKAERESHEDTVSKKDFEELKKKLEELQKNEEAKKE